MGRKHPPIIQWLEGHAGWLMAAGLAAAVAANWRQWQVDRRVAHRLREGKSLRPALERTPRVSFLIPAWNEAEGLAACLASVLALSYPTKELIVCAGGRDGTFEIARRFVRRGAILLEQAPDEGKQRALQRCFERSTGEIIFLTDADSRLDDDCFERTIAPIAAGPEDAVTGSRQPLHEQQPNPLVTFQWADHLYQEGSLPDYVNALYGINAAVRREALEKAGAFTGQAPIGTDLYLAHRLLACGVRIRFARYSRVQTDYLSNPSTYIRQQSRWFRNRFLYGLRDRAWGDVLGHLRAGLAAILMLAGPLVGIFFPLAWALWLPALAHLGLAQARMAAYALEIDEQTLAPRWRCLRFFPYLAVSWIAMARGLFDSLLPTNRDKW